MADMDEKYPFETKEIEPEQAQELRKYYNGIMIPCEMRYGPKGYMFPKEFKKLGRDIYNMEVRAEDTFVVTVPKSGTTWTQEMVWLIVNDFDYEKAIEIRLNIRYPFIEMPLFIDPEVLVDMMKDEKFKKAKDAMGMHSMEEIKALPNPRFLKSHIALSLLPPNLLDTCKVVYVARDPRDVAVSYYHHSIMMKMVREDMEFKDFWKLFKDGLVPWSPIFPHIKEAWESRNHPNMLFLFYEELSKDLPACVRRVAKFLGKDITDDQLDKLCDHLNIKNFRKNKSINLLGVDFFNKKESFIRKGKVGGWRDYFDEEMAKEAEQWIQENLQDTDFRFIQE